MVKQPLGKCILSERFCFPFFQGLWDDLELGVYLQFSETGYREWLRTVGRVGIRETCRGPGSPVTLSKSALVSLEWYHLLHPFSTSCDWGPTGVTGAPSEKRRPTCGPGGRSQDPCRNCGHHGCWREKKAMSLGWGTIPLPWRFQRGGGHAWEFLGCWSLFTGGWGWSRGGEVWRQWAPGLSHS